MRFITAILNWIKGWFKKSEAIAIEPITVIWQKIVIDLNRFVLHLWHEQRVVKVREYVSWSLKETFVQLPKAIIEPLIIVRTKIEVKGHLDVIHHGNVNDPIVRAELHLKHETHETKEDKPEIKVSIKAKERLVRYWELDDLEMLEEKLIEKDINKFMSKNKNTCYNGKCGCQKRGRGHDNRKTLRRKEERRASINRKNEM